MSDLEGFPESFVREIGVRRNCKCFQSPDHPPLLREIARVPSGQIVSLSASRKTSLNRLTKTETKFSAENSV